MRSERLLRVSYSTRDARQALKQLIPFMASGFNVNAIHGNCSVNGADAKALADLLAERIVSRLEDTKARRKQQGAGTKPGQLSKP